MKIIVHKTQSDIYTPKENAHVLEKVIKSIQKIENYNITWVKNHFIVKYPLTGYHKTKILNAFRAEALRIENKKVISGFKGCLITGYKFEWL